MKRWGFNIAADISLMLCLSSLGLWVRGCWAYDEVYYRAQRHPAGAVLWGMSQDCGAISIGRVIYPKHSYPSGWYWTTEGAGYRERVSNILGFAVLRRSTTVRLEQKLFLPDWSLVLTFATLPFVRLSIRWRGRQRRKQGFCIHCCYDLRATPDRCPECGTPVPAGHAATLPPSNPDNNVV